MSALASPPARSTSARASRTPTGPADRRGGRRGDPRRARNQYPPGPGIPELRQAIAAHQLRFYGLASTRTPRCWSPRAPPRRSRRPCSRSCEPGDEVIAFEPYYDSYAAASRWPGAHPRAGHAARRRTSGLDLGRAGAAFTPRTRLILLNTPHNPTGTVFTRDELAAIAALAVRARPARDHRRGLRAPGVRRPSTCRSRRCRAWPTDRARSARPARRSRSPAGRSAGSDRAGAGDRGATVKQFLTYVSGGAVPGRAGRGAGPAGQLLRAARAGPAGPARPALDGLAAAGLRGPPPAGTYFVTTDIRPLGDTDGIAFCRPLPERAGVVAIPTAVFYDHPKAGRTPGPVRVLQAARSAGRGAAPGVARAGRERGWAGGQLRGGTGRGRLAAAGPGWETDAMRPDGLHHVSINVSDVGAARDFYTRVLGLTERADRPDFSFDGAWLDAGNQQVHLIEAEVPAGARAALRPGRHRSGRGRGGTARAGRRRHRPGAGRPGPPGVRDRPVRQPGRTPAAARPAGDPRRSPRSLLQAQGGLGAGAAPPAGPRPRVPAVPRPPRCAGRPRRLTSKTSGTSPAHTALASQRSRSTVTLIPALSPGAGLTHHRRTWP